MRMSGIYRKALPIVRTSMLAVGIGMFGYACGSSKKSKKPANLPAINLRSCIKKERKTTTVKPRQAITIEKAPIEYRPCLEKADKRGYSNGKIEGVGEVRHALGEYSKTHGKYDLRNFFNYLWKKAPHLFSGSANSGLAARVILKTYPYNWGKKMIDTFLRNKRVRELINIMPEILMGIKQRSPRKILKEIRLITKSISYRRFEYDGKVYREIVRNRILDRPDGRPLALVVFPHPRSDYNKAFEHDTDLFSQFIKEGYRMMYYEASTDRQFYSILKLATNRQRARVIIIGGHGSRKTINFGYNYWKGSSYYYAFHLDTRDKKRMIKRKIGSAIEVGGSILLYSCSTGQGREQKTNMANVMREVFLPWVARIWSPVRPSSGPDRIIFDKDHNIDAIVSPDTYDPLFGSLVCPKNKSIISERYISTYIKVLKSRPPKPGMSSAHANYLWCIAVSGKKAATDKVVRGLIDLFGGKKQSADAAVAILKQIAVGKVLEFGRLIGKKEYLPQIFTAWEKGILSEEEFMLALQNISRSKVQEFLRSSIRAGNPIKNLYILKAAVEVDLAIEGDFLNALLITSLGYSGGEMPDNCKQAFSSPEALAYARLVEGDPYYGVREKLRKIALKKSEDKRVRRSAARILGDLGDKASKKVFKKILGVGLFNRRDKDEELCKIAMKGLKKIRSGK